MSNVQISDLSKSLLQLETTAGELDQEIDVLQQQIRVLQQQLNQKQTQKTVLRQTALQIMQYRSVLENPSTISQY